MDLTKTETLALVATILSRSEGINQQEYTRIVGRMVSLLDDYDIRELEQDLYCLSDNKRVSASLSHLTRSVIRATGK